MSAMGKSRFVQESVDDRVVRPVGQNRFDAILLEYFAKGLVAGHLAQYVRLNVQLNRVAGLNVLAAAMQPRVNQFEVLVAQECFTVMAHGLAATSKVARERRSRAASAAMCWTRW